jgi:cell wall-associated NlpC family hydrolase
VASHRHFPQPGLAARTTRVTVFCAAAVITASLAGGTARIAIADPGSGAADRVDLLYRQAERATELYDAAQERTRRLRDDLGILQHRAARGQERVNTLRDELGTLAAEQYRGGGLDPWFALLLTSDPDTYLYRAATLDRLSGRQTDRLLQLRNAQRRLRQHRAEAAGKLTDLEHAAAVLHNRKRAVRRALAEARRILAAMSATQRAAYAPGAAERVSRGGHAPHIAELPAVSGRAAIAVAVAREQLGAPYVWGAAGPHAFDCSGLTQYAYGRAGVALPRTSQEQLHTGHRVPLSQARPGDLVVYGDASHVGMYVGGGQVIHAPYPGARVRYDAVNMMPVTAVTRP